VLSFCNCLNYSAGFSFVFLCFDCTRYAFLTFGSRSRMLDAYNRYSSRRLVADDQVIHVIKYEAPKAIPTGKYFRWSNGLPS